MSCAARSLFGGVAGRLRFRSDPTVNRRIPKKPPRYGELPPGTEGLIEWKARNLLCAAQGLCELEDLVSVGTARAMAQVGHFNAAHGASLKTWCSVQAYHGMRNYLYSLQWAPTYKVKLNAKAGIAQPRMRPLSEFTFRDEDRPIPEAVASLD